MSNRRFIPKRIVENCWDCPYLELKSDDCKPEGWYCKELNKMVVNYRLFSKMSKEIRDILNSFPDWCPLEKE